MEPWWEEMSGSVGEWKGLYRVSLPAIQMVVRVEGEWMCGLSLRRV